MKKILFIIIFLISISIIPAQGDYSVIIRVENLYWYQNKDDHLTSPEWRCDYYADLYLDGILLAPSSAYTYKWYQNDTGQFIHEGQNSHYHFNDGDAGMFYDVYVEVSGSGFNVTSDTLHVGKNGTVSKVVLSALSNNRQLGELEIEEHVKLFTNPLWIPPQLGFFNMTWEYDTPVKVEPVEISEDNTKFNHWNETDEIMNFINFAPEELTTELEANFTSRTKNVVIQKNFAEYNSTEMIGFKDPWLQDKFMGENLGYQNQGMSAPYKYFDSIDFSNSGFSEYKGVLLDQNPNFLPNIPYYTIKIPSTINVSGRSHPVYLLNWDVAGAALQDANSLETGVVFNSDGAEVTANLKGSLISNNYNAYASGSQRKFIRTYNKLCQVYSSMGKIWMESSSDNGQTWDLLNNKQPLNSSITAKNPSLSLIPGTDKIAVVFQDGSKIKFMIAHSENISYGNFISYETDIVNTSGLIDANPVVAVSYLNEDGIIRALSTAYDKTYVIVWQKNSSTSPGLYYRTLKENYLGSFSFVNNPSIIGNTNANSENPSITTNPNITPTTDFHLVWQQKIDSYNTELRYYHIRSLMSGYTYFSGYAKPSSGSGYARNTNPSIVIQNNNNVNVYWVSYPWSGDNTDKRVVARTRYSSGSWSGYFNKYGAYVTTVNANTYDDLSNIGFVWVEEYAYGAWANKFRLSNIGYTRTLNSNGTSVQLCSGGNLNQMYAMSYQKSNSPYEFKMSGSLGSLVKSRLTNYVGRQGIVRSGEVEYYCTLSDAAINDELVEFVQPVDTFNTKDAAELNSFLRTKEFSIKEDLDLTLNLSSGTTNLEKAKKQLNGNNFVKFIVNLIDAKNNEVISRIAEIIFNKDTDFLKENSSYRITSKGTKNKMVRITMAAETNMESEFTLASIESDKRILMKPKLNSSSEIEIKLNPVNEYSLLQNHPNPFNPSTTITFALPQKGEVVLKIYNSLGQEVKNLVNGFKEEGIHKVNFNASNLPSGVYIYSIKANDFIRVKR